VGYVAVEAGEELIQRAADLFEKRRIEDAANDELLSIDAIEGQLGRLVGQTMSEAGLYAPRLAALAVKQAQGDTVEASFLLRAYRSTLERWDESDPTKSEEMFTTRRVSPAYKDVPGGQMLGATKDYTQRLLDFDLIDETDEDSTADWEVDEEEPESLRNVMKLLREEDLVSTPEGDGATEPMDTTREPTTHPVPRSGVLQELARGETGAVTALGYSALRGYGQVHPTLGEVRTGELPLRIEHPYTGEPVEVTSVEVTETEAIVPRYEKRDDPQFAFGYGLVAGRNERKAIGMSILDASIQMDAADEPAENAEFVLDCVDGIDSFGFIEHLKLPHYVTFQSILDRIRAIRERTDPENDGRDGDAGNNDTRDDSTGDDESLATAEVNDDD
jgi:alpha-D-ribose 1-methylphosphonate 5-triphosphate synthase subunit PhnI